MGCEGKEDVVMIKEMNCINYYPGDISMISGYALSALLLRDGIEDKQRQTNVYYIYAHDNLLGGK